MSGTGRAAPAAVSSNLRDGQVRDGLIAYNLMPKKPEMNIEIIDKSRMIA